MTAHKHFKQLVRARMVQTGESYTSARRHLLKTAPSVNPGGAGRWHFPGAVPATTALRALLAAAGVKDPRTGRPFSEELLFVICGGVGMGVASFYYAAADFASFYVAGRHLWYDHLAYFNNALDRFGMKPVVRESSGAKTALGQLREALAEGPCVAWVEGYHVISVYGVDEKRGVALIGDLGDEPEEVSLERLAARRAAVKQCKNRLLSLGKPVIEPNADLAVMVRSGVGACVEGLKKGKKGPEAMSGLERLAEWRDHLAPAKGRDNWRQMFPRGHRLWTALTSAHDFIEHRHTGGGLCRPIFADGLTEASELAGLKDLSSVSKAYSATGAAWTNLAEAAMPAEIAAFRAARELSTCRAELKSEGQSLQTCEAEIERQKELARSEFPLTGQECDALLGVLHRKVAALYEMEVAAGSRLAELLK